MNINIAIVEDDTIYAEELKGYIQQSIDERHSLTVDIFEGGEELLERKSMDYHAVFMDIKLGGRNGLEVARILRDRDYKGEIIFSTSYSIYQTDGFSVKASGYLVKPVPAEKVKKCMDQVLKSISKGTYCFTSKGDFYQIDYSSIFYFSSAKRHYIEIVTDEGRYLQKESIKIIITRLPDNFQQCHRSVIVNMDQYSQLRRNELVMKNGDRFTVSENYINSIRRYIADQIMI